MRKLHIDFETYSECDIRKAGTWAYSRHPSTEVLFMAWAFDDDEPALWLPSDDVPDWAETIAYSLDPVDFKICAWNDFFEYCIMRNVLGWHVPPPEYWEDTAAKAAALALPRGLADCGVALNLESDRAKDKAGKKLIQLFSVPKVSQRVGGLSKVLYSRRNSRAGNRSPAAGSPKAHAPAMGIRSGH